MAKDMTTYPVSKGKDGKFFGYADATQIAKSKGKLKLFDPSAAERVKIEKEVAAVEAKEADTASKKEEAKQAGGADASAVKKGPASK